MRAEPLILAVLASSKIVLFGTFGKKSAFGFVFGKGFAYCRQNISYSRQEMPTVEREFRVRVESERVER